MTKELKGPGFHFDVHTDLRADQKAEVLIEALPWLEEFAGQRIVIKYGGNAMIDDHLKACFAEDMVFLRQVGLHPVVVHGGGPQISHMLKALGIKSEFKGGLRVTTPEAMDVVRMVLTGKGSRIDQRPWSVRGRSFRRRWCALFRHAAQTDHQWLSNRYWFGWRRGERRRIRG